GIDEKYVIVDVPPTEEVREFRVKVEINGNLKKLEEVSSLVRVLKTSWLDNWRFGVYTKKEFVEEVKKAAIEYFGIEKSFQSRLF
ncbi:MAG: HD domain-containing protein, partial [Archaeoglobaceae archaeon]